MNFGSNLRHVGLYAVGLPASARIQAKLGQHRSTSTPRFDRTRINVGPRPAEFGQGRPKLAGFAWRLLPTPATPGVAPTTCKLVPISGRRKKGCVQRSCVKLGGCIRAETRGCTLEVRSCCYRRKAPPSWLNDDLRAARAAAKKKHVFQGMLSGIRSSWSQEASPL